MNLMGTYNRGQGWGMDMYTNEGTHRIHLLAKCIVLFGSLAGIALWVIVHSEGWRRVGGTVRARRRSPRMWRDPLANRLDCGRFYDFLEPPMTIASYMLR